MYFLFRKTPRNRVLTCPIYRKIRNEWSINFTLFINLKLQKTRENNYVLQNLSILPLNKEKKVLHKTK